MSCDSPVVPTLEGSCGVPSQLYMVSACLLELMLMASAWLLFLLTGLFLAVFGLFPEGIMNNLQVF